MNAPKDEGTVKDERTVKDECMVKDEWMVKDECMVRMTAFSSGVLFGFQAGKSSRLVAHRQTRIFIGNSFIGNSFSFMQGVRRITYVD